jgi:hypothetical protein
VSEPLPMRPGFVIELQHRGALVLRKQTSNAGTALHYYTLYLRSCGKDGSVYILQDEREITGSDLRAIVKERQRAKA